MGADQLSNLTSGAIFGVLQGKPNLDQSTVSATEIKKPEFGFNSVRQTKSRDAATRPRNKTNLLMSKEKSNSPTPLRPVMNELPIKESSEVDSSKDEAAKENAYPALQVQHIDCQEMAMFSETSPMKLNQSYTQEPETKNKFARTEAGLGKKSSKKLQPIEELDFQEINQEIITQEKVAATAP